MIHIKGKNMFHFQAGKIGHVTIFYCDIFMASLPKNYVYLITLPNGCDFSSNSYPLGKLLLWVQLSTLITFPDSVVSEGQSQQRRHLLSHLSLLGTSDYNMTIQIIRLGGWVEKSHGFRLSTPFGPGINMFNFNYQKTNLLFDIFLRVFFHFHQY